VIKAPATLTAFSASYADTGLFGVHAVSASNDIGYVSGWLLFSHHPVMSSGPVATLCLGLRAVLVIHDWLDTTVRICI
jgi:hypothetical protein